MGEGKKRIIEFVFLLSFPLWAITVALSSESCLRNIQKRYSSLPGLVISYERSVTSKTMNLLGGIRSDVAKGKLFLRPPYFLRIEQEQPDCELVISNEKEVWWYIPSKEIAYRYKAEKFSRELNVLKYIFTGIEKIKKDFSVSCEKKDNFLFLILIPIRPWQDIEKIQLKLSLEDFRINMIRIYNTFGSITCFRLKQEIPKNLDKSLFYFNPPKGIRIITKQ